jgi:peroxiredoxin
MPISVGSKAPLFTLKTKNAQGVKEIALADELKQGPVVILFFPLAFTSVCTDEFCDVSSSINAYTSLGARVLGISIDSPFAQEAWAQKNNIAVTLLSDLNKTVAKDYGVLLDDLLGFGSTAARAAFVIDKNGIVRYSEQTPTPKDLPNFEAIKKTLKNLS